MAAPFACLPPSLRLHASISEGERESDEKRQGIERKASKDVYIQRYHGKIMRKSRQYTKRSNGDSCTISTALN